MTPKAKNILQGIIVPAAVVAICAAFAPLLSGCASLWSEETAGEAASAIRTITGTDALADRMGLLEDRQTVLFGFVGALAEKEGISETDARDWLAANSADSEEEEAEEESAADVDAVDFALLQWKYGGVDGSKAKLDSPRLSNLRASANAVSYKWDVGLDAWGMAHDQASALCCLFVTREDGSIVGGKFDWVSTSRRSRELKHIFGGYGGWTLDGVPNPTQIYFVVITADGRKRSNVVTAEWSR